MIVTRTPFRITLGGGGTDLPSYYSKYGGFIFAAALDKYMFVDVNRPVVDDMVRLKYAQSETVEHIHDLQHAMAREIFSYMGIERGIEVSSIADLPAGTGLGSSSCYAVGLLHALHTLKRDHVSLQTLAEEDFKIESEILKRPIGKQDPYLAAFGGLTVLEIGTDGLVVVKKPKIAYDIADALNQNLLIFFTGLTRSAEIILSEQEKSVHEEKKDVVDSMHYIKELGYKILESVEAGNISDVGKYFHAHWEHKKKISTKMSNPTFDRIYAAAIENGALGGKISGAGGGGFFVFYVENGHQLGFRKAMREFGLREMRYRFDFEGSKILVDF